MMISNRFLQILHRKHNKNKEDLFFFIRKGIMTRLFKIISVIVIFITFVISCSTEKNTFISRTYHGLTAHYNGYFNANELIRTSLETYKETKQESFYDVIPIELVPDENEVINLYAPLDTAIGKCTKVITNHSMPSNDRPSRKKEEWNKWIDENWITIGIANYYRRDYETAIKSFEFVKDFYTNDPSVFVADLWLAKIYLALEKYADTKLHLDNIEKAIQEEKERKKEETFFSRFKKKKKEKIAEVPKKLYFEFFKTKADLAYKRRQEEAAIRLLEESLKHIKKSKEKARIHFVLGQLYEKRGERTAAQEHYKKVIKNNPKFNMAFNARLKKAFLGDKQKTRTALHKMLKDAKNAEFKDQIYYALAMIELEEGNEKKAIENLHLAAFYSVNNTRQKGMAYEKLGDLSFSKKDYVSAQKYYDSCAQVINDSYPNAEAIRNKAKNLERLVIAVETAIYEDSVQRIAKMDETTRKKFLKDYIKQIKKEEEEQKRREAIRLRELQENQNVFAQTGSGSKWYWNNSKLIQEGFEEFKRLWGERKNEDHWRRSEKEIALSPLNDSLDNTSVNDTLLGKENQLTVEGLQKKLPLSDSAMNESMKRLLEAHYNAGLIYKQELNEKKLAEKEFKAVLSKNVFSDSHTPASAFQLYKILQKTNSAEAEKYKSFILENYPDSDYAKYLKDPDYFIKKRERDKLAEQKYIRILERYNRGLYYAVLTKTNKIIKEDTNNIFLPKLMLLNAMAQGQLTDDKTKLLPVLEEVVTKYPDTEEAKKAKEMIDIIKNGYSKNTEADFSKKTPFIYNDKADLRVIIFPEGIKSTLAKSRIMEFNREFFSREKLKISSKIYGKDKTIILVSKFDTESDASRYIRVFKKTRKYLLDLQKAKIFMITLDNLKILFQKQNLEEYEEFYEEYY